MHVLIIQKYPKYIFFPILTGPKKDLYSYSDSSVTTPDEPTVKLLLDGFCEETSRHCHVL